MNKTKFFARTFSTIAIVVALSPLITAMAEANKVAKAVMLRGQVKAKATDDSEPRDLKQDDWVSEGTQVQTADKSFVKFMFQDQSQVSLGPNSKMVIGAFPKNDPGLIKLINGQLKSQVTKDPLKGDDNKLLIKTKTAAMGVRGTELMVVFNQQNQMTNTITFEGQVAMAHLPPNSADNFNSANTLSNILSGDNVVTVAEGQFSGSGPTAETSLPQKMNPAQFETLATNQGFDSAGGGNTEQKQYQSPVPPNVVAKDFANQGDTLTEALATAAGKDVVDAAQQLAETVQETRATDVPPEGMFNASTGEFAPPAGGFIDLNTGLYIPPPPGSTFDPQSGVYLPPATFGSFDPATGAYMPPAGTTLKPDGTFVTTTTEGGAAAATLPPPIAVAPGEIKGFSGGVTDVSALPGGTAGGGEFFGAKAAAVDGTLGTSKATIDDVDVYKAPVLVTPIPAGLNSTTVNINVNVI